jgi:hypothetical protein
MDTTNRGAVPGPSGGAAFGRYPAKQEEVVPAQFAAVRQQNPVNGFLNGVADADASKLDRSAMRTVWGVHNLQ